MILVEEISVAESASFPGRKSDPHRRASLETASTESNTDL
jgi:hypothetical protein